MKTGKPTIGLPVIVRVLVSDDEEAVSAVCVTASLGALATTSRIQARVLDVTALVQEDALVGVDVLLIPGGEPRRLRHLIGGVGASAIRSFVRGGGGYVGICAGAVLATRKAPTLDLAPEVRCVDDNVWWTSGLAGEVALRPPEDPPCSASVEALRSAFRDAGEYQSGPLLAIDAPKPQRKKPSRREREAMTESHQDDGHGAGVITAEPLALFAGDVHPWRPDRSASRQPERGSMSGAVAALATRHGAGCVVLSSVHPELSGHGRDALLLEEMCLFAAGRADTMGVQAPPAHGLEKKQPCPRCGHKTSKAACKKCGCDLEPAS